MSHEPPSRQEPWLTPWPHDGLEQVGRCPACGSTHRAELYNDVVDNAFLCAPGVWNLWQCGECECAYLDPRPSPSAIHMAYSTYYTHQEAGEKKDYASLSLPRKLRRSLVNGYTNWRYSTRETPSISLGIAAVYVMPNMRKSVDRKYRHLPKGNQPAAGSKTLLDIGCGNGSFLKLANECGWEATGLDPDPKAISNCRSRGLTAHQGGIDVYEGKEGLFDVITLSHVIEHVHHPAKLLEACLALLKPGGQLWLETPNVNSFGHKLFKQHWRGLEAPRHLVLFSRPGLIELLRTTGFIGIHTKSISRHCRDMFRKCYAMQQGFSPYRSIEMSSKLKWQASFADGLGAFLPARREFLTVIANKPKK